MPLEIEALRKICSLENIEVTTHAARRLEQRGISVGDILSCIKTRRRMNHDLFYLQGDSGKSHYNLYDRI